MQMGNQVPRTTQVLRDRFGKAEAFDDKVKVFLSGLIEIPMAGGNYHHKPYVHYYCRFCMLESYDYLDECHFEDCSYMKEIYGHEFKDVVKLFRENKIRFTNKISNMGFKDCLSKLVFDPTYHQLKGKFSVKLEDIKCSAIDTMNKLLKGGMAYVEFNILKTFYYTTNPVLSDNFCEDMKLPSTSSMILNYHATDEGKEYIENIIKKCKHEYYEPFHKIWMNKLLKDDTEDTKENIVTIPS